MMLVECVGESLSIVVYGMHRWSPYSEEVGNAQYNPENAFLGIIPIEYLWTGFRVEELLRIVLPVLQMQVQRWILGRTQD